MADARPHHSIRPPGPLRPRPQRACWISEAERHDRRSADHTFLNTVPRAWLPPGSRDGNCAARFVAPSRLSRARFGGAAWGVGFVSGKLLCVRFAQHPRRHSAPRRQPQFGWRRWAPFDTTRCDRRRPCTHIAAQAERSRESDTQKNRLNPTCAPTDTHAPARSSPPFIRIPYPSPLKEHALAADKRSEHCGVRILPGRQAAMRRYEVSPRDSAARRIAPAAHEARRAHTWHIPSWDFHFRARVGVNASVWTTARGPVAPGVERSGASAVGYGKKKRRSLKRLPGKPYMRKRPP